jgi:hypothetical protein
MCGISALITANADSPAAGEIYEGLNILQHRGQVRPFASPKSLCDYPGILLPVGILLLVPPVLFYSAQS